MSLKFVILFVLIHVATKVEAKENFQAKVYAGREITTSTSSVLEVSLIQCQNMCVLARRKGTSTICGYDKVSETCFFSSDTECDVISTSVISKVVITPLDSCIAIYKSGKREDGIYTISPDGQCPFDVFCDMNNGGWTVIQKRFDGSVDFYQPWTSYVNGFGNLSGEHWLGLEKIHRLSSQPVDIYFNMTKTADQRIDYAHNKYFTVNDATTKYTMWTNSDGYEGTLPSTLFTYHNGMKFSTYDQDNDVYPTGNCANDHHGAWWFAHCYRLGNMNGLFGVSSGMAFYGESYYIAISKSTIKIKMAFEE